MTLGFTILILFCLVLIIQNNYIMSSQAELTEKVNSLTERVNKIGGETGKSLLLIEQLKEQIANLPSEAVTPELQTAVDNLEAQLIQVDNMTPDPVEPETPTT